MTDYLVAAFSSRLGRAVGDTPEGKIHAFLPGARATVCGFGLSQMRSFKVMVFTDQPSSVRCSMCDRIVRAAAR